MQRPFGGARPAKVVKPSQRPPRGGGRGGINAGRQSLLSRDAVAAAVAAEIDRGGAELDSSMQVDEEEHDGGNGAENDDHSMDPLSQHGGAAAKGEAEEHLQQPLGQATSVETTTGVPSGESIYPEPPATTTSSGDGGQGGGGGVGGGGGSGGGGGGGGGGGEAGGPSSGASASLPPLIDRGQAVSTPSGPGRATASGGPRTSTATGGGAATGGSGSGGAPSQQQQQQQQQQQPLPYKPTEELARESGYPNLVIESALAKRLSKEPGLRLAQQRRQDQVLNLNRRSNVEALFAHVSGQAVAVPCKNCHKGHGPWNQCVVVDGQMCGSCANCWYNASGARCSFHEARNPMPVHVGLPAATSATTSFADGSFVTPSSSLAMPPPATARQAIGHTATTQAPSLPPISTGVASSPATAGGLSSTSPFGAGTFTGHHAGAAGSSIAALLSTVTSTSDPVLRQAIERTMEQTLAELRSPDRARRQLMLVEIAARQLAVHIAEYEAEVARQQQQPAARAAPGGGGTAGAGAGGAAD